MKSQDAFEQKGQSRQFVGHPRQLTYQYQQKDQPHRQDTHADRPRVFLKKFQDMLAPLLHVRLRINRYDLFCRHDCGVVAAVFLSDLIPQILLLIKYIINSRAAVENDKSEIGGQNRFRLTNP